ncbi:MAG: cobalamin-binding protein [Acidobacteriota bacterium]|nr:cobalamin-binding protein [Acidobacteriota bacterium]
MPRIISLVSSATEIVYALGAEEWLVGRSHECDYPAEVLALPCCSRPQFDVVGNSAEIDLRVKSTLSSAVSIYEVLDDVLAALQPTHILTQTQCEVCAVSLGDVERSVASSLPSRPIVVSLKPDCLADIWEDIQRVADSIGLQTRGETLVSELKGRIQRMSKLANDRQERPRVACLEWLSPLMAAGNWVPELVGLAGGENLFGEAGKHSPWLSWDALRDADPDVILAMPCGFDQRRTESEMYWLAEQPGYDELKAVRSGKVFATDGSNFFNRPGPRIVESFEMLCEMIHGGLDPARHLHHHHYKKSNQEYEK